MKHLYYFPGAIALIRAWAVKYKAGIGLRGADLGLSEEEIEAEQALCDSIISAIDAAEEAMATAETKNSEKEAAIKDSMKLLRPKIQAHKNADAYTEAIGRTLGVIGAEIIIDPATVKSTVKAEKVAQGIDLKFTLEGCEAGYIYCKRGSETVFTMFKYVMHPSTVDTRSNLNNAAVEARQYYVVLAMKDEEVGQASDIVTVSC